MRQQAQRGSHCCGEAGRGGRWVGTAGPLLSPRCRPGRKEGPEVTASQSGQGAHFGSPSPTPCPTSEGVTSHGSCLHPGWVGAIFPPEMGVSSLSWGSGGADPARLVSPVFPGQWPPGDTDQPHRPVTAPGQAPRGRTPWCGEVFLASLVPACGAALAPDEAQGLGEKPTPLEGCSCHHEGPWEVGVAGAKAVGQLLPWAL